MGLAEKLTEDMKAAMKSGDKARLSTIRQLRAQLKDEQIALGHELSEEEILTVLTRAAKKRREAIDMYEKGGRTDLSEAEKAELAVIQDYLPKALGEEELLALISSAIEQTGASGMADFGKVMKVVMGQTRGRADGKQVQNLVKQQLAQD